jgi:hypothetical protein
MEILIRQGLPAAAWVPIASLRRSKQLETAKEQPGNWLFFRSGAPTAEDFRGNASSLADNFSAEQQKQPAAPEGWLSGSRR